MTAGIGVIKYRSRRSSVERQPREFAMGYAGGMPRCVGLTGFGLVGRECDGCGAGLLRFWAPLQMDDARLHAVNRLGRGRTETVITRLDL